MKENQSFSSDPVENKHLQQYIAKKAKKNSRLRVGRKNQKIKQHRKHRFKRTAVPLCLFFLVIGLGAGYFVSPFSKVKTVKVIASQQSSQFKHLIPIHSGDSLLMIKNHEARINDLVTKHHFNVKNVKIKWKNHNQALVKINFYHFYGYVKRGEKYYAANARGEMKAKPGKLKNVPNEVVLSGFSHRAQIKTTLEQYEKLPNFLKANVKEIKNEANANDENKVRVILRDKNQVILQKDKLAKKMAYYPSIKTTLTKPSFVNLEYGAYATPINK